VKYRLVVLTPRMRERLRRILGITLWVVSAGALASLVFAASFYFAMRVEMRSTEVEVPALEGLDLDAAHRLVAPLELVLQVNDQRHDPAVPSGHVLQQMPPSGSSVRRGRKIKLVLSLGGKVLEVPDLIGHAARAVTIELRQEGFQPGEEARVHDNTAGAGTIIGQVPPARTPAVPATRVHRLVSDGPRPPVWVMPDLAGLSRRAAERWIASAGFRRGAVRQVSIGGRPAGTVVGQLPLAGYPVRSKEVVELTVAR
jgi:serine/threonine-protein kinase